MKTRKILAIVFVLALVVSLGSLSAFAAGELTAVTLGNVTGTVPMAGEVGSVTFTAAGNSGHTDTLTVAVAPATGVTATIVGDTVTVAFGATATAQKYTVTVAGTTATSVKATKDFTPTAIKTVKVAPSAATDKIKMPGVKIKGTVDPATITGITYTYQWYVADKGDKTAVPATLPQETANDTFAVATGAGADGAEYTIADADVGKYLYLAVSAGVTSSVETPVVKLTAAFGPVVANNYAVIDGAALDILNEVIVIDQVGIAAKVTGTAPTQKLYLGVTAAATAKIVAGKGTVQPAEVKAADIKKVTDDIVTINVSKNLEKAGVIELYMAGKTGDAFVKPIKGAASETFWIVSARASTAAKVTVDATDGYVKTANSVVIGGAEAGMVYKEEADAEWYELTVTGGKATLDTYANAYEVQVRIAAKVSGAPANGNAVPGATVQAGSKVSKVKIAGMAKAPNVKADFIKGAIGLKAGMQISSDNATWLTVGGSEALTGDAAIKTGFGIAPTNGKYFMSDDTYDSLGDNVIYVRTGPSAKKPASAAQVVAIYAAGDAPDVDDLAISADNKKLIWKASSGPLEYKVGEVWKKGAPKLTENKLTTDTYVRFGASGNNAPSASTKIKIAEAGILTVNDVVKGGGGGTKASSVTIAKGTTGGATIDLTATAKNFTGNLTYAWTTADGTITSGAATAVCTVEAAGIYTVTVTTDAGDDTATANVTVDLADLA